jgi:DNA-3-methyladenine glycosylase II
MIMNRAILDHFHHIDPILSRLAEVYGEDIRVPDEKHTKHFLSELCETIVGQQLSVKAAATIWSRVKILIDDWDNPSKILECDDIQLRSAGLSGRKVSYVKNIARGILDGTLNPETYSSLSDSEIIKELVMIKGIGVWTAEMFLIFTLGKHDVFSIGDLGLRNAIKKYYGDMSSDNMLKLSNCWSPYRSYASLILWRSLDNSPKTN